jgi:hypothetical protein
MLLLCVNHPHEDHKINHESGIQPSFATITMSKQLTGWRLEPPMGSSEIIPPHRRTSLFPVTTRCAEHHHKSQGKKIHEYVTACRVSVLHFSSFKLNHLKIPSTSHMVRVHVHASMFKGLPFLYHPWASNLTGNIMAVTALQQRWGQTVFQPADAMVDLRIFDDDDDDDDETIMHPKSSETHSTNYMR